MRFFPLLSILSFDCSFSSSNSFRYRSTVGAISPLTLDNNERDFTVLAQSIEPLMWERVGRRCMSQMMMERSPRDNGAVSRFGYLCVCDAKGGILPLLPTYHDFYGSHRENKTKMESFFFCFCFVFSQVWEATLAEFTLRSVAVGENPTEKQKSKSSLPHSLFSHLPEILELGTSRCDTISKKVWLAISLSHSNSQWIYIRIHKVGQSRKLKKRSDFTRWSPDLEIRRKNLNGCSRTLGAGNFKLPKIKS